MKKRKKKLTLSRETLRVETFMRQVVGGYQSQQCGHTDLAPDSECNLCGPDPITAGGCYSGANGTACVPSDACYPETVLC